MVWIITRPLAYCYMFPILVSFRFRITTSFSMLWNFIWGVSVSFENLFIPNYPMDQTLSYSYSPNLTYGVVSNTIAPVNMSFFEFVEWKRFCTESLSSNLRVSFSITSLLWFCKFSLYILLCTFHFNRHSKLTIKLQLELVCGTLWSYKDCKAL